MSIADPPIAQPPRRLGRVYCSVLPATLQALKDEAISLGVGHLTLGGWILADHYRLPRHDGRVRRGTKGRRDVRRALKGATPQQIEQIMAILGGES